MLNFTYADCHSCLVSLMLTVTYQPCYAECRYAECRYAECGVTIFDIKPCARARFHKTFNLFIVLNCYSKYEIHT
jgi:hypothetical protein